MKRVALPRSILAYALVAALGIALGLAVGGSQVDFRVFYLGGRSFHFGLNPYHILYPYGTTESFRFADAYTHHWESSLPFVTTPVSLLFFSVLSTLPFRLAATLWLAVKFCLAIAYNARWVHFLRLKKLEIFMFGLLTLQGFNGSLIRDLNAGNFSVFEQFALWGGVLSLLRGSAWPLTIGIALAAQCKLAPAAFLLLPLLFDARKHLPACLAGLALIAALASLNVFAAHGLLPDFLHSIRTTTAEVGRINPCLHAFLTEALPGNALAEPAYLGLSALLVGVAAFIMKPFDKSHDEPRKLINVMLFVTTFCLIVPRLKQYQYFIMAIPTWIAVIWMIRAETIAKIWKYSISGLLFLLIFITPKKFPLSYSSFFATIIVWICYLVLISKHKTLPSLESFRWTGSLHA